MKSYFRFGQPIGTSLVILALVETIYSSFWLLLDFVSLEHTSSLSFIDESITFDFFSHLLWHFWLAVHFLMSCVVWLAVIFESRKHFLYIWLILSFMHNAMFVAAIISQVIIHPTSNKILVYLGVVLFITWRCYTMSVACQGLRRLRNKYDYRSDSVSDMDICLEPLGNGCCQTWEFYKDLPGAGAVTLLTVELVWNVVNFCTRPLVIQMFGLSVLQMPLAYIGEVADYLLLEETVVRSARILLDILGIYFLFKEKLSAVRIWVCFYFLIFVISNLLAAFMITHWWVIAPEINIIIYHVLTMISDNIFRLCILYFTIKYGMVHVRTIAKL